MAMSYVDIEYAFEMASTGECPTWLDRRDGKVHLDSEMWAVDDEPLPDDLGDNERYIAVPDKRELGLGKSLVINFVSQFLPECVDEVYDMFRRKGAYGRFKALLAQRGAVDRWHDFSAQAEQTAIRQWCAENEIELSD